jgi:hypothetical protein
MHDRTYYIPKMTPELLDALRKDHPRCINMVASIELCDLIKKETMPTPTPLDSHDPDIALYTRDEPGPGGAFHHYTASVMGEPKPAIDEHGIPYTKRTPVQHTEILFQKGGKVEAGPNGITQEVLLEIVRHRLACFQAGPFACKENAAALKHVEDAIMWLNRRTSKRRARGVEGKSVK